MGFFDKAKFSAKEVGIALSVVVAFFTQYMMITHSIDDRFDHVEDQISELIIYKTTDYQTFNKDLALLREDVNSITFDQNEMKKQLFTLTATLPDRMRLPWQLKSKDEDK